MPCWRSSAPAFTRWCRAADRSARAAIWRRSPTWRWCSSARARRSAAGGRVPGAEALATAGLSPVVLGPKEGLALINGTQASTAVLAPGARRAPSAWPAPPTWRRRCRSTRCEGRAALRRREFTPPGRTPGQAVSADNLLRLMAGQRHQRLACRLRARCRTPTPSAARPRCTARHGTRSRSRAGRSKSKRTRRPTTRWSSSSRARSSRAATSTARRWRIAADLTAIAVAQFATISERRSERLVNPRAERPARLPHRAWGTRVGTDAGPGDGGRAHVGAEVAGASRVGRLDSRPRRTRKTT